MRLWCNEHDVLKRPKEMTDALIYGSMALKGRGSMALEVKGKATGRRRKASYLDIDFDDAL